MATPLNRFRDALKVALGDRFYRDDATRLEAMRLVLRCGQVPGHQLTPDGLGVTPDLDPPASGTPLAYLQLIHRAALAIACPDAGAAGFDTRAYKQRLGDAWQFIHRAERILWEAETGAAAAPTWQTVGGLLNGVTDLGDVFNEQAAATVSGGFPGLNFSTSGVAQA